MPVLGSRDRRRADRGPWTLPRFDAGEFARGVPETRLVAQPVRPADAASPAPPPRVLSRVPTPFLDSGRFVGRVAILGGLAVVAFAVLGLRLWSLQVLDGSRYRQAARRQTTRVVSLPAVRGTVVDSVGRVLVGTAGVLDVTADPQALGAQTPHGWRPSARGRRLLGRLAGLAGTTVATLVSRIQAGVVRDPSAPATLLTGVPESLASYLSERADAYRGITVAPVPTRRYPQGALGGTFLGLLGQLTAAEVESGSYPWAKPGETVGQSGVEAAYDSVLNGGFRTGVVHVDSLGRTVGPVRPAGRTRLPATLQLTIDSRLQRAAQQAVRTGVARARAAGYTGADGGAAVVMDPRTGAIEALVSSPELNQGQAARDPAYLARLLHDAGGASPLFDRATQGLYPLGSTFKPIVAEAALSAGLITPSTILPCVGSLTIGGTVFHNFETWINEPLDLAQALQISCDTWFYRLGEDFFFRQQQGKLDIQRWARLFGLGRPTGLDIPGESAGVVPTPAWLEHTLHQTWYEGDSVNLSIGQGFLEATPLQLAVAYAALANGGTVVRPHVGEAVIRNGRRTTLRFPPVRRLRLRDLAAIRQGLYLAANASGGTSAGVFAGYPVAVAGKTGTAQVPGGSDDSWYASFAPASDPRVVVVVLITHGGFGSDAAAPAARQIYDAYFRLHGGGTPGSGSVGR